MSTPAAKIASLDRLDRALAGRLVLPGDGDWDAARTGFNTALDIRPTAVALPRDARDAIAIVRHAKELGLRIAPESTGHNQGPLGDLSDTILLSASELHGVEIDAANRRVRVGAATKWEKVGPQLSELGLAGLHGSSPDVGITGYSLGGGMGWLARKYGLQTNSVTAIELVTADGELRRVDADHEPDLFWALRGGNGNYGFVTALEFDVYPVRDLYAGAMFFGFERAGDVLHAWREALPTFPEELMTWACLLQFPDVPVVPEPFRGGSYAIVMGAYLGEEADGRALLRSIRALGPTMDTFAMSRTEALADLAMDPPDPLPIATTHHMLGDLPAGAVDDVVAAGGPGSGSTLAMLQFRHLGGALARRAPGAGARATLPGNVSMFAAGITPDAQALAAAEETLHAVHDVLLPHRVGDYPNFVEEPADARSFFDEVTWARLRRVKAAYDPGDLFKGNHHIPPAV
jgi:FAD/FMN-containing dehydrogenase